MSLKELFFKLSLQLKIQHVIGKRCFSSKPVKDILETVEETPIYIEEKDEHAGLEEKRNKSRLNPPHRNMVHDLKPYDESQAWYHDSVKYKKRILGRYGIEALGRPAGMAWPTPEEVKEIQEYEKVAFPLTIQERLSKIKEKKRLNEERIMARQQEIGKKMVNMNKMIADIQEKVAEKEAKLLTAQMTKERKIEEIRRKLLAEGHVGTDRIEEELTQMEKTEKKKKKEARKTRLLEKQKEWAMKLMQEAKQEGQKDETVEDKEKTKEDN